MFFRSFKIVTLFLQYKFLIIHIVAYVSFHLIDSSPRSTGRGALAESSRTSLGSHNRPLPKERAIRILLLSMWLRSRTIWTCVHSFFLITVTRYCSRYHGHCISLYIVSLVLCIHVTAAPYRCYCLCLRTVVTVVRRS